MAQSPILRTESDDAVIRQLMEGTAGSTGPEFFSALVKHLAEALNMAGALVTQISPDRKRLRAYSFWFDKDYVQDFDYEVAGTPCERVVVSCELFHVPENIIQLFPEDQDLVKLNAVSYIGIPLLDGENTIMGHLAALDVKPLPYSARVESILRIFGARAAAEIQRLRSERRVQQRERQLSSMLDSAWDAILVVDSEGKICDANRSCGQKLGLPDQQILGREFASLLGEESASRWNSQMELVAGQKTESQKWWLGNLEMNTATERSFPAEASVSGFERDGKRYFTIILRDLFEQREAEKRLSSMAEESRALRAELDDLRPVGQLIGESASMRTVFGHVRQIAVTNTTVLICGETGTGKELVARAIHEASPRHQKPMVRVNCGAIPANLMESEFFGHERGAFTGATERREGRFALADGGTLFLDEIGELPLDLQVKLLRVLQEGEFEPVGSSRTRKVDVRIIAATNRDLANEVKQERFRADLFYRLNVFPIQLPPLRERYEDVVLLAEAFLARMQKKWNRSFSPLSRTARETLCAYDWPGNVRELENVLERSAILSRGQELVVDSRMVPSANDRVAVVGTGTESEVLTVQQMLDLEKQNLIRALEACNWQVAGESGAAARLGMAPSTLSSRMKALRIKRTREIS